MPNAQKIIWVNIFAFINILHYGIIVYAASTYLGNIVGQNNVWTVYLFGAGLGIIFSLSISNLIRKINIFRLTVYALIFAFLNLLLFATTNQSQNIFIFFGFFLGLSLFIISLTDIALKDLAEGSTIGSLRGRYLSVTNLAYLISPLISSFIINWYGIDSLFIFSSGFVLLAIFIFLVFIRDLPKIRLGSENVLQNLKDICQKKELRGIFIAQFGLSIFYSLTVIYIPFKLYTVGINLEQYLSILLPIALTPFIFIPILVGHFEDKMRNEKELIIISYIGIILMLCTTALSTSSSLLIWAFILFTTRAFASTIETSTNSYFYKFINSGNTGLISIFSNCSTLSDFIFIPVFGIILYFTDLKILFLCVSFLLCFMLLWVVRIKDNTQETIAYEKKQNKLIQENRILHKAKNRVS